MSDARARTGACLCGAVRFTVRGPLRAVIFCHCTQCRKQTGHFMAATAAWLDRFVLVEDRGLRWFRASDTARRGFCALCGSTLFWQADDTPQISIAAGSLDGAAGLVPAGHIYCADKGEYYEITDGDFRLAASGHTVRIPDG